MSYFNLDVTNFNSDVTYFKSVEKRYSQQGVGTGERYQHYRRESCIATSPGKSACRFWKKIHTWSKDMITVTITDHCEPGLSPGPSGRHHVTSVCTCFFFRYALCSMHIKSMTFFQNSRNQHTSILFELGCQNHCNVSYEYKWFISWRP